jgi:hypothetical protein
MLGPERSWPTLPHAVGLELHQSWPSSFLEAAKSLLHVNSLLDERKSAERTIVLHCDRVQFKITASVQMTHDRGANDNTLITNDSQVQAAVLADDRSIP